MTQEKLVRDKIPELIRQNGEEPKVRRAEEEEMDYLLRAKIVEEAKELLESGELEEIVDICEAIETLLKHKEITKDRIKELRMTKNKTRGAFSEGFVLISET